MVLRDRFVSAVSLTAMVCGPAGRASRRIVHRFWSTVADAQAPVPTVRAASARRALASVWTPWRRQTRADARLGGRQLDRDSPRGCPDDGSLRAEHGARGLPRRAERIAAARVCDRVSHGVRGGTRGAVRTVETGLEACTNGVVAEPEDVHLRDVGSHAARRTSSP